jgi:hypothetical protein
MSSRVKFDDDWHKARRDASNSYYHEKGGNFMKRIYYLMKTNNISRDDIAHLETPQEIIMYCEKIHIERRYQKSMEKLSNSA